MGKYNVSNSAELQNAMTELQKKIDVQEVKMKDHYEQVKENLQPKNVLKNTYSHIAETPELQRTLINTILGFVMGFAFKKASEVLNEQSLDRLAKNIIDSTLTKLETRDRHSIISKGITMLRRNTPADSALHQYIGYRSTT
ncbi:hypothetical protein [Aridibaculum aurantiacum]|uniref:hypothetical protein n=1 Tax=Aridibaculum aurantiacum TaxID=2810307 RepID=UPI001A96105D|nr:hypothetical protein [Aridibaculum aurantiacum]